MGELKLFVLGEYSPNPDEWAENGEIALVVARDKDEAMALYPIRPATEISLNHPFVLCVLPHYGADI